MGHIAQSERILGSMLGLAVGDALGTTVEFQTRDSYPPVTDMVGGGTFGLAPGQWTDDTSMALCLATSLVETGSYDPTDQLRRFYSWYRDGYLSSTGRCFDIGNQTTLALHDFEKTGAPYRTDVGGLSAGNGSLMRLAPVALAFSDDCDRAQRLSADSSRTTHPADICVDACGAYGRLIAAAVQGMHRLDLFALAQRLAGQVSSSELAEVLSGSYRVKAREEISSSGYVLHSMEAALWAFASTENFHDGALLAVNLGDDADTVGAIYGQLAGAYYGVAAIPEPWRGRLYDTALIETLGHQLAAGVGEFTEVAQ